MQEFRQDVIDVISKHITVPQNAPPIESLLTTPKDVSHGDFALPVFVYAKQQGQNPVEYAKMLAESIAPEGIIASVEPAGPFLNVRLNKEFVAKNVLSKIHAQKGSYGSSNSQADKTYVIDYSAPNIAKPFGIGHLRSTVLGSANKNILKFLGAKVIGINYIGDWGTQFGKVIWAYKAWGDEKQLQADPITYLLELYVKFHESPTDEMKSAAREIFAELEKGNPEYMELWKTFRDLSLQNFEKTYQLMNVSFDEYRGEAYYNDKMQKTLDILNEKNLLEQSDGAQILNFEKHTLDGKKLAIPPIIILKSDGGSTYALRDIAAAQDRIETFSADKLLYEVGSEQQLHFQQVFTTLKLMGFEWAKNCEHLGHGLYRLPEGKMSTRKGRIVLMEDVLADSIKRVEDIMLERNPDLAKSAKADATAKAIGVGAVLFYDMKHDRIRDIEFNWERVLDFQGETGPYIQYTYARICAMQRKKELFDFTPSSVDFTKLQTEEDREIILQLSGFADAITQSAKNFKPHVLCRFLLDLAQLCNNYYGKHQIISDDEKLTYARLFLLCNAKQVIEKGLALLGISVVDEM